MDITTQKLVWTTAAQDFPVNQLTPPSLIYCPDDSYPLDFILGIEGSNRLRDIQDIVAEKIDGVIVDVFDTSTNIEPWLLAAVSGGCLVAPSIDLVTWIDENPGYTQAQLQAEAVAFIENYCTLASSYPSAATTSGSYVIFIYDPYDLPPSGWTAVRAQLVTDGFSTWCLNNIGDLSSYETFSDAEPFISSYFSCFEASYEWKNLTGLYNNHGVPTPFDFWAAALSYFAGIPRFFMPGVMPGYDRELTGNNIPDPTGGYLDAQCTAYYRAQWDGSFSYSFNWMHLCTWNDHIEHHVLQPDSQFGRTLVDLTSWYASVFKSDPYPFNSARLYLTTPQMVLPNGNLLCEALCLNPTATPQSVSLSLYDNNNNLISGWVSGSVAAYSSGTATISLPTPSYTGNPFFTAQAQLQVGNSITASVVSAPIVVSSNIAIRMDGLVRILYYSISNLTTLTGSLAISNDNGMLSFTIPGSVSAWNDAEILYYNTSLLNSYSNTPPAVANIGAGVYVARLINTSGQVLYSIPFFVASNVINVSTGNYLNGLSTGWEVGQRTNQFNSLYDFPETPSILRGDEVFGTQELTRQLLSLNELGDYNLPAWLYGSGRQIPVISGDTIMYPDTSILHSLYQLFSSFSFIRSLLAGQNSLDAVGGFITGTDSGYAKKAFFISTPTIGLEQRKDLTYNLSDPTTVNSFGGVSGAVAIRPAASYWDFITAFDPVYICLENELGLVFRNLDPVALVPFSLSTSVPYSDFYIIEQDSLGSVDPGEVAAFVWDGDQSLSDAAYTPPLVARHPESYDLDISGGVLNSNLEVSSFLNPPVYLGYRLQPLGAVISPGSDPIT